MIPITGALMWMKGYPSARQTHMNVPSPNKNCLAFLEESATLCSSSEDMLKLSFVICTTLSTPGFLIIDSICLDRYLLIENVMQLGFEVNILTWGLEVFCFSVRVHYCLISFHVHPEICPSCQNFQIKLKKWKLF